MPKNPRPLPDGTVTFVFTDIEGSTTHLRELGDREYGKALEQHRAVLSGSIARAGGVVVDTQGDGLFAAFADAPSAVAMAVDAQTALSEASWPGQRRVRTRFGLHTGTARRGAGGYVGLAVHQAARIAAAAHGGQVLASRATVDLIDNRSDASWRALGSHRLKDLGSPLELFQLCHPRLPADFPPPRTLEGGIHNFPVQFSTFVGRAEELALGAKLLETARCLTITGAGGTGKTRLALQLAAENLGRFGEGAFFAELAPLGDGQLVGRAVLNALGISEEGSRSEIESVVTFLQTREVLVLLDNCEHVVTAARALVREILSHCPHVRVLATSRTPLGLSGETIWTLEPLRLPEQQGDRLLESSDAVRLFCERAAEARVGFTLSAENAAVVSEICTRLDGLPLALEIAAARVRTVSLAEIRRRLGSGLDLHNKDASTAHPKHSSVRATLSWSHDLLSAHEQVLFRRLSVFRGGFDVEAAEAVVSDEVIPPEQVLDALEGLVDKSLVELRVTPEEEGRYRLLEPVRAYAAERLEERGETEPLADRHARYFVELLQQRAQMFGIELVRLDVELNNILAALDRIAGSDDAGAHGEAVCAFFFLANRSHYRLGTRELTRYLERNEGEPLHRIRAMRYYGNLSIHLGEYEAAGRAYGDALIRARELGDRREIAICLRNCAQGAYRREDHLEAESYINEALEIASELGDDQLRSRCIGVLGLIDADQGRLSSSAAHYAEALTLARRLHDSFAPVWQTNLGATLASLCRYEEAESELVPLCEDHAHLSTRANALENLGEMYLRCGRYDAARLNLERARDLGDDLNHADVSCAATVALAKLAVEVGDYDEAVSLLERGEALARGLGSKRLQSRAFCVSGWLALEKGEYLPARDLIEKALEAAERSVDRDAISLAHGHLGMLASRTGPVVEAEKHLDAAIELSREVEVPGDESRWRCEKAELLLRDGRVSEAASEIARALRLTPVGESHGGHLQVAGAVLAALEKGEAAARALAAGEALDESVGRRQTTWARARADGARKLCSDELGESRLEAALADGRQLEWEAAVAETLAALDSVDAPERSRRQ